MIPPIHANAHVRYHNLNYRGKELGAQRELRLLLSNNVAGKLFNFLRYYSISSWKKVIAFLCNLFFDYNFFFNNIEQIVRKNLRNIHFANFLTFDINYLDN